MERASKTQLKEIRELLRNKKKRDEAGLFVVEGSKIISDISGKGGSIRSIVVSDNFTEKNGQFIEGMEGKNIEVFSAGNKDLEKACSLRNPEGVLAVVDKPKLDKGLYDFFGEGTMLLLDNVQDPGNVGTIIRLAAAFQVLAVILYGECADEFNPKTVRASSGAIMSVPTYKVNDSDIDRLKKSGMKLLAACPSEEKDKKITRLLSENIPKIIAFGSEGKGVSDKISKKADDILYIPIADEVESLNVASAAAITLYEIGRGEQP